MRHRPALFLDRDGVVNMDYGYVYKAEDIEWVAGAAQAIATFNALQYLVIVVTNQSGIARGYYTEQNVHAVHKWMNEQLARNHAHIDGFYYCPHHPEGVVEHYRKSCSCRKPEAGMILQAIKDWRIDPRQSLLVGDRQSDLQAAATAGIEGCLFPGGNLYDFLKEQGKISE